MCINSKNLKKIVLFVLFFFSFTNNIISQNLSYKDKNQIRSLSVKYREAISSSRGENLLPLVSNDYIDYYKKLKNLALYATKDKLLQEEFYFIIPSILYKPFYSFDELNNMSAKELLVDGYTGQSSTFNQGEEISIDKFIQDGNNKVIVRYNVKSSDFPLFLAYTKEKNKWKVDIAYFQKFYYGTLLMPLYQKAKEQGYTKKEFILIILQKQFGLKGEKYLEPLISW